METVLRRWHQHACGPFVAASAFAIVAGLIAPSAAQAAPVSLSAASLAAALAPSVGPDATIAAAAVPMAGAAAAAATVDASIRPFHYRASDGALADLRRRVAVTKWPDAELVPDATQGVQLAFMRKLADYWATGYNWRKVEARLDALPQFVTTIDGVDIHFIHVKSKNPKAMPLIITHGWPGSVVEELKIIDPLTNPTAHGASAADSFDVVIPSLPGYGFSGKPREQGWDPARIARAWATLMTRLGYKQFVASGGDWGDPITEQLAILEPERVRAIHLNMPSTVPAEIQSALAASSPAPASLTADEKRAYEQLDFFYKTGLGYANEMRLKPQSLYAIEDSPIGLAGWLLDHDIRSYELITRVFDGKTEGLTRDDVLDNITLYWLTNTAVSSSRLYWENKFAFFVPQGVTIPVAVSAFPDELYQAPRSWSQQAFPKLIHYNRLPKGGHFAAWEQPELFSQEVRAAFRSVR